MKSKALTFIKSFVMNKASLVAFLFLLCAVAANATTYNPPTGAAVTAEEVDSVWNKAATLMSGTGGKLAALGVIVASVWNRLQLGTIGMGVGIVIGILIPTLPSIIDNFSYCI